MSCLRHQKQFKQPSHASNDQDEPLRPSPAQIHRHITHDYSREARRCHDSNNVESQGPTSFVPDPQVVNGTTSIRRCSTAQEQREGSTLNIAESSSCYLGPQKYLLLAQWHSSEPERWVW